MLTQEQVDELIAGLRDLAIDDKVWFLDNTNWLYRVTNAAKERDEWRLMDPDGNVIQPYPLSIGDAEWLLVEGSEDVPSLWS